MSTPSPSSTYALHYRRTIAELFEGETLTVNKISRLHMGAYLCIASNGVPPSVSKRILLNVHCKQHRRRSRCAFTSRSGGPDRAPSVAGTAARRGLVVHDARARSHAQCAEWPRQRRVERALNQLPCFSSTRSSCRLPHPAPAAVPPMIWVPNQLIGAPLGGEAVLQCNTEAFPISINYWTKDDDDALMESPKYDLTNAEKSYKVQMTLRIRVMEQSDFGTYKCVARNSLGSTEGSIKVYGERNTRRRCDG